MYPTRFKVLAFSSYKVWFLDRYKIQLYIYIYMLHQTFYKLFWIYKNFLLRDLLNVRLEVYKTKPII